MTSIYNSQPAVKEYNFCHEGGIHSLVLIPDLNLDINPKLVASARKHLVFATDEANGILRVMEVTPDVIGQDEGKDFTDLPEAEKVLVTDHDKIDDPTYHVDKSTLLGYSGIGSKTADKILSLAPDGQGTWANKKDFKADLAGFGIDYNELVPRKNPS